MSGHAQGRSRHWSGWGPGRPQEGLESDAEGTPAPPGGELEAHAAASPSERTSTFLQEDLLMGDGPFRVAGRREAAGCIAGNAEPASGERAAARPLHLIQVIGSPGHADVTDS